MSTVTLLVVIVVVVVVVAVLAVAASVMLRKRRSERLREEFGPEYERTLQESDDPNAAEADLRRREKQRSKVQLRALDERERTEYRDRWDGIQREFVDDPGRAVEQADRLVVDVMSTRGYPADDVDRRADDLSVDYPVITQRYREAREISRSHQAGRADTEDLRGAVTSYRELVYALLDDSDARDDRGSGGERNGALPRGDRHDGPDARDDRHRDAGDARDRARDDLPGRDDRVRDDRVRDDRVRDDRDYDDRDYDDRGRDRLRDDVGDRDAGRSRDGLADRDAGRDRMRDDRADVADRDARDDRGRGRDDDPGRDGDRDGRRMRDVVKDKVTGRDGPDDRRPDGPADRDRDRVDDRRDGDQDRDDRRVRDVVKDKVTGRDSERGPDARERGGSSDGQAWERGRHAFRTEDDPRRETTT
jgi:hypothetical protein